MLYVKTCQISRPSTWILFCGRGEADLEIRTDDARILHWCGLRARRQCMRCASLQVVYAERSPSDTSGSYSKTLQQNQKNKHVPVTFPTWCDAFRLGYCSVQLKTAAGWTRLICVRGWGPWLNCTCVNPGDENVTLKTPAVPKPWRGDGPNLNPVWPSIFIYFVIFFYFIFPA